MRALTNEEQEEDYHWSSGCALALAAILAVIMLKKFAPNKTHMSLTKYFQVTDQGMMPVVLDDDICGLKAIEKDGHIYVDREFVTEKLNHRFYWDANEICCYIQLRPS